MLWLRYIVKLQRCLGSRTWLLYSISRLSKHGGTLDVCCLFCNGMLCMIRHGLRVSLLFLSIWTNLMQLMSIWYCLILGFCQNMVAAWNFSFCEGETNQLEHPLVWWVELALFLSPGEIQLENPSCGRMRNLTWVLSDWFNWSCTRRAGFSNRIWAVEGDANLMMTSK